MRIRNIIIAILMLTLAFTTCQQANQNKERQIREAESTLAINELTLLNQRLSDSLQSVELQNVTVDGETQNIDNDSEVRVVYRTDYRSAVKLKRLQQKYDHDMDTLAQQRDSFRIREAMLEDYCVRIQEQNDSTVQILSDSLAALTLPWKFHQEDLPWYSLEMTVETPQEATGELWFANENIVDMQRIKKNVWETITFKPRRYRTVVTSMNPYTVDTDGTTYYFDKVKAVKE